MITNHFRLLSIFLLFIIWLMIAIFQGCNNSADEAENANRTSLANLHKSNTTGIDPDLYAGTASCISCHEQEHTLWKGSHHDRAMMVASDSSVYGDFNDVTFTSQDVSSRFYKKGDKFMVNTEGPDGRYYDYEIVYTFGETPLQQYIVEFPKGKFQCLRTAWDTEKKVWFDLYPDLKIVHEEWLHWTNGGLSWNLMCSDCHSTNVRKNYSEAKDEYNTTYTIINVSCEACHGPAKKHVEIVNSEAYEQSEDKSQFDHELYMKKAMKPKDMVDECARCHARRTQYSEFYDHKGGFLNHYSPDVLRDGLYFADGQIQDEVYVYGSFIQSKMYAQNIKCADCHDIHSLKLKFDGNKLCLQCHVPEKYDVEEHHFHPMNTESALCVSCHMQGRTYMGNDFRRDHSFRVPRPDLSAKYGMPNACNYYCHEDKSASWSADWVKKWYGPDRKPHFSEVLAEGRERTPESIPALIALANNKTEPAIARATAIWYMSQSYDRQALEGILKLLSDPEPIVRYHAVTSLQNIPAEQKAKYVPKLLKDEFRPIRASAAGTLVGVPSSIIAPEFTSSLSEAQAEYMTGLEVRSDFPGGQMEKAQYFEKLNQPERAEGAYLKAIELDNYYNTARINLAGLYYGQQRFDEAEVLFKKVIEQEKEFGQAYYSLGLLYAEMKRMEDAVKYLGEACEKMPENPRVFYNYGLTLRSIDRKEDSFEAFRKGLLQVPQSEELLYALAYFYFEDQNMKQAKRYGDQLVKLNPDNPGYKQLLQAIVSPK